MARFPRAMPTQPDSEEQTLLDALLHEQVPQSAETFRPVALHSVVEQRRIALRPFLLRTWFDYALQHTERLLLLGLLVFFAFWFLNGYGRDWLYERRQAEITQLREAILAARNVSGAVPQAVAASRSVPPPTSDEVPLPFTTDTMIARLPPADYLTPQRVLAPPEPADQRPQRLLIPPLNADIPVIEVFIEDGAWQVADYAAGFHHGTAMPGTDGNTVMAGHAGLRGAVFGGLGALRPGDDLFVDAGGWRYHYAVRETKSVWPTQTDVMAPTPTPVLTLITCTAWDTKRLIVVADLIGARPFS